MILAGDVGGTKVVLALFEDVTTRKKLKIQKFASKDFENFQDIVKTFLPTGLKVHCACFGIAGPIQENTCHATNLPWVIDRREMEKTLHIPNIRLINDLEANAWGVFSLTEEEFYVLNPGVRKKGNRALISAGTGLGEAGFYYDGKNYFPFASEGGHTGFSPDDEEEVKLWRYFKNKFGHASFERFLSGHGIEQIYRFFIENGEGIELQEVQERMRTEDPAQVISECALQKKCPVCIKTLDRFVSIYGGEAGNLALKFLALGGLYVGGGIAPKILEILKNGNFMRSFVNKGRFKSLLSEIEVKIILNPETALLGAARFAKNSCTSILCK